MLWFLRNDKLLDRFLARFREGRLPKEEWTHAAHVTLAADYCLRFEHEECLRRVREEIRRFNESVGGQNTEDSGYHETLTVFWLLTVRNFLANHAAGLAHLDAVRRTVEEYGNRRDCFRERYSFDVVRSREARLGYVPPDR